MHTETFYNPVLNQIRSTTYEFYSNMEERGFVRLGDRKIAEAFTSVSPQERLLLWKAFKQGRTYSFDFSMLNSKLIHKLRRLGLRQLERRPVTPGEELLNKIKQFNLDSKYR